MPIRVMRSLHRQRPVAALLAALAAALTAGCFLLPAEEAILPPPLVRPPEITYRTRMVELDTIERASSSAAPSSIRRRSRCSSGSAPGG